uniref:Selenocysteine-specific elongation factor n=1 Tax=Amphimedon queenslandica TaxID=400682 RepID=A0A1X7VU89_AMPQE
MAAKGSPERSKVLNFNIGVLGHVDSGKTSLAKALSSVASTAAFDKHPQSQERGITLDLGFSSFSIPIPEHLKDSGYDSVQFTLVDCPGHASLIRTIIGGAQIIDLMILVVDAIKGIQTQTAECLIIGEITCDHMIVALNKIDLFESSKRDAQISKISKRISKTLEATRFNGALIVPVAAAKPSEATDGQVDPIGIEKLIQVLSESVFVPNRSAEGPLIYSVDHCFPIRGQGTVMTGTVLNGSVHVNDNVEIPSLKLTKKVKSMQMFHQPVERAIQGDRVGICVTQFDPKSIERCLVCSPGALPTIFAGLFKVTKVRYHKLSCLTGSKLHVTIGHETIMAKTTFFGSTDSPSDASPSFNYGQEYSYQEELESNQEDGAVQSPATASKPSSVGGQYALVEFERPVIAAPHCVAIASKLDVDLHIFYLPYTLCTTFYGNLLEHFTDKDYQQTILPRLRVFKIKSREGVVERMQDEKTLIGKGLFKRETKIQSFIGLQVTLSTGEEGMIEGAFGTTGKFRLNMPDGLKDETKLHLKTGGDKKKGKGSTEPPPSGASSTESGLSTVKIYLKFKRYIFDTEKKMIQ